MGARSVRRLLPDGAEVILAGDVGGTKVALALVERADEGFRVVREKRYATADHAGLAEVAGDLAISGLALRGVRLGGGIARDVLPILREGPFLDAFHSKGRMRGLLEDVPVEVVLDSCAPLLGAARWATLASHDG